MNPVAAEAEAAFSRAMDANQNGEIADMGPQWACDQFGRYGHNYYKCISCLGNFNARYDKTKEAAHDN